MRILHIASDFSNTKVHSNLYRELDQLGVEQVVFNPIRTSKRDTIGRNEFLAQRTQYVYADVVKPIHRYLYHVKQRCLFGALQKSVNLRDISLVHATTLLTDGGVAYKIYKKYHIPYIVAVRNTDVNDFLKLMPHTWVDARRILLHAEKILCIGTSLYSALTTHKVIRGILPQIENHFEFIPNGISDYYLDHISHELRTGHKIVYVGRFDNNKNVVRLAEAVLQLRTNPQFSDCTLTLVGGGRAETDEMERMITAHPDVFKFLGPIYEQEKLCEVFAKNSIFAMPSIHETFGLVYIEALTQNLPILYTRGQGVDGLLPPTAGIAVNPRSVSEISEALATLLENKNNYYNNSEIDFTRFRWNLIAQKYIEIYNGCKRTI